jgi:hypothetical protein
MVITVSLACISVVVKSLPKLLKVVSAGISSSRFSCLLDSWEKKTNQYADYCDNDKEFDEGKTLLSLMEFHSNSSIERHKNMNPGNPSKTVDTP